jgi:undecaprenyl-phosphate 4-deoxy-4-formamido-L-arabinose transferase
MSEPRRQLSIVIPIFNSAETLPGLLSALVPLCRENDGEIVLVNDGSRDATGEVARGLLERAEAPVLLLNLSRNFGEHNAVIAGLRASSGEYVVTMDDDLQNPPAEVMKLVRAAQADRRDVVYSSFARKKHSWWRNAGSAFTNIIANYVVDKPRGLYLSSFRCLSRLVADEVAKSRNPFPYIDGLIFQVTQNVGIVQVDHAGREQGRSGYTLRKLVRLWLSMLINVSVLPLRLMTFAGLIMSALGFLAIIEVVAERLLRNTPTGWSSVMAAIFLLSGTQLLLLGIMGEYVGRIYLGLNEKPQSVVREVVRSPRGAEPQS